MNLHQLWIGQGTNYFFALNLESLNRLAYHFLVYLVEVEFSLKTI